MLDYIYNLATDKYQGFIPSLLKAVLFVFSLLYGLIIRCLIFFYQLNPYKPNIKIISIGNITFGGTGKTPLVEYAARKINSIGKRVTIITRGYKSKDGCSDEEVMLKDNLPRVSIVVSPDRARGIKKAADFNSEVVILDDGFQQWRIKKDLEILLVNALNPFGNQNMIPRGILREPLSSLKRADIFVISKVNPDNNQQELLDYLSKINPKAEIYQQYYLPVGFRKLWDRGGLLSKDSLSAKKVSLVSAIGDPDSFKDLVKNLGLELGLIFEFADHHCYSQADLDKIISLSKKSNINTVITTNKDAVKLRLLSYQGKEIDFFVLSIEPKFIQDEEKFDRRLFGIFNS